MCFVQDGVQTAGESPHGEPEHRLAVHLDGGAAGEVGSACADGIVTAGAQGGREHGALCQLKHSRPGAIAKQHAGGAVLHVHQAGERLTSDHQGVPSSQGGQQAAGHGGPIDETGTGRVHIQRGPILRQAKGALDLAGHAGRGAGTRQRGTDTAVDLVGGKPAAGNCLPGRVDGQRGGVLVCCAEVALTDAGA